MTKVTQIVQVPARKVGAMLPGTLAVGDAVLELHTERTANGGSHSKSFIADWTKGKHRRAGAHRAPTTLEGRDRDERHDRAAEGRPRACCGHVRRAGASRNCSRRRWFTKWRPATSRKAAPSGRAGHQRSS